MKPLEEIEKELSEIKERNRRVETDKAWEISWTRRILILILTYIVVVIFFITAKLPDPFINAIVPSMAFLISTSSISLFKKIWLKNKSKH